MTVENRKRWRRMWTLYLIAIVTVGQYYGVGMTTFIHSVEDTMTIGQAVYEIWSLIAMVGLCLLWAIPIGEDEP